jgi:hypothetical protein
VLAIAAVGFSVVPLPRRLLDTVFIGCWASVILCTAIVYLRPGLASFGSLALSLNAGFWSGCVIGVAGSARDLFESLPCALVVLPAAWVVIKGHAIVVKVACSWLFAIAVLATTLQFLPVTPGYLPDHVE